MTGICSRGTATATAGALTVLACALLAGTSAARAADVTYERLLNPEPQNWLSHHRDYSGQRYSPLETINKGNVKNLKLLFAVSLGVVTGDRAKRCVAATLRYLVVPGAIRSLAPLQVAPPLPVDPPVPATTPPSPAHDATGAVAT